MDGNDVGDQVRRYRLARRMSQRALGEQAGVTSGFLSQLEFHHQRTPSAASASPVNVRSGYRAFSG